MVSLSINSHALNPEILKKLMITRMPYGKYKGTLICDIPAYYLEWYQMQGFPKGEMGMLLSTMFEIKTNGLDYLLVPLRQRR